MSGQPAISPFGDIGRCGYSFILLKSHSNETIVAAVGAIVSGPPKSKGKPSTGHAKPSNLYVFLLATLI